jgi:hypothetical protein
MKKILAIFFIISAAVFFSACDKAADLPFYRSGTPVTLSASATTVAPPPADSTKTALTLNWTFPNYATDSGNMKYIVQIDSAGKNFTSPATKTVVKNLTTSYLAKELNDILLGKGYAFNVPVDMDVRIVSSYVNNNDRLLSNVVRIKMTPYKIPPKVALPAAGRLFIVGDATTFGWSNDATPPFPPEREFSRIDETTWGGIFYMNGTGGYKLLQTQGNWSTQFHMLSGGTALSGGFEQKDADPGFPSPTPAGWYKLIFDFQAGKYTVTPFGNPLAQELYITGDATAGGWVNNPPANQKLTRLNSAEYQITMSFVSGKFYKFLSSFGNWQPQFGGNSATGGDLGANYGSGSDPAAVPTPGTAGSYKVTVNFATNRYSVQ